MLSHLRSVARYLQVPQELTDEAFGRGNRSEDNGKPCRFSFSDIWLEPQKQPITRIRIDHFTGGVMTGGLFRAEPLTSRMEAEICGPQGQDAACALMLFALRDLGLGLYKLGSGWSVGWGLPRVKQITANQGSRRLTLKFTENNTIELEDPDGLAAQWKQALGGVCHAE